jgi:hypothetical protein
MADCHLCGSVNLESSEEVFTVAARACGHQLARMPDGETGERRMWIWWQIPRFAACPQLVQCDTGPGVSPPTSFALRSGVRPEDVDIELGYAEVALESYALFLRLRRAGVIAQTTRFQVSLPTQLALSMFIAPKDQAMVAPTLDRLLHREVRKIVDAVPSQDLAIQWDVAIEMGALEGIFRTWCGSDERAVLDSIVRQAHMVPGAVELGFHLCYGDGPGPDGNGRHWKEPTDTTLLVRVANELITRAQRKVEWVHMPVPIDRDDDAYFAPLTDLDRSRGTCLYLGLVHHEDGIEGARRRVKAAARRVRGFGVATECGMGRTPRQVIPQILRIQAELEVPQ